MQSLTPITLQVKRASPQIFTTFLEDIKTLLFDTSKETIANLSLPQTMKHGLMVLMPKPDKDSKILDNWRPITLLNNDYKLLTYILQSA